MEWTREKPTKEGNYWYRAPEDDSCVVVVVLDFENSLCAAAFDFYDTVDSLDGEWAGPIPYPDEREEG